MDKQRHKITANSDVFGRIEGDGKLLLVQAGDSGSPQVLLLENPGSEIWSAIQNGVDLADLLKVADENLVLSTLSQLQENGFIEFSPEMNNEYTLQGDSNLSLDPWEYQFSQPYLDRPWFALWEVTDHCPIKSDCLLCYRPENEKPDLPRSQWEKIIKQISASQIPFVTLLGGEPLCHKDIFDIIKELRRHRIYTKVITNGLLIEEGVVQKLAQVGLNQIAISLDGLTPELNDLCRGEGAFDRVISAARLLRGHIPRVSLSFTVSNRSFNQMEMLPDFCASAGFNDVYISPLRSTVRMEKWPDLKPLSQQQMTLLHERIAQCNDQGLKVIGLKECSCGRSSCVIHPDGGFSPCPFADREFGNILKEDIATVWGRTIQVASKIGPIQTGGFCFSGFLSNSTDDPAADFRSGKGDTIPPESP